MAKKSHLQTLSSKGGIEFARGLRRQSTDVERLLWSRLRSRQVDGWKFRRQVPLGRYVVDFLCEEVKLIVELDGGQHSESIVHDAKRTDWLVTQGYQVIRFWNNDITENIEGVLQSLTLTLQAAQPTAPGRRSAGSAHARRNHSYALSQGRGDQTAP